MAISSLEAGYSLGSHFCHSPIMLFIYCLMRISVLRPNHNRIMCELCTNFCFIIEITTELRPNYDRSSFSPFGVIYHLRFSVLNRSSSPIFTRILPKYRFFSMSPLVPGRTVGHWTLIPDVVYLVLRQRHQTFAVGHA